jgi:hypothetical protein
MVGTGSARSGFRAGVRTRRGVTCLLMGLATPASACASIVAGALGGLGGFLNGMCLVVGGETERPDGRCDLATRHCDRDSDQRPGKDCAGNSPCEDTDLAIHRGSTLARDRREEVTSRRLGGPRPSFRRRRPPPRPPRRPTSPPAHRRWPGQGRSHPSAQSSPGRIGR